MLNQLAHVWGFYALAHLDRRGTVLVRYVVGDVLAITHQPCPHCGRNGDRLVGPVVRTKDLMKVKGMLMSPDQLQEAIRPRVELTGANDIYDPSRHAKAERFVDRRSASAGVGE